MKIFLTSSMGGVEQNGAAHGSYRACMLDTRNGFVTRLRAVWPQRAARVLAIASSPETAARNDGFAQLFAEAFALTKLPVETVMMCDDRNAEQLPELLRQADVILLSGGHVPTQNAFFARLHLREQLQTWDGVLIGISAGSMNSAETVYAQPELDEEVKDPRYVRYLPGLGLTSCNILPHFQELRGMQIGGLDAVDEISCQDSRVRPFYAFVDGTYLYIEGTNAVICGEAYYFADGQVQQISSEGDVVKI